MQRVPSTVTGVIVLSNGKYGYRDADLANGIDGTEVVAVVMNTNQEELAAIVEADGTALDPSDNTQVLAALKRMFRQRVVGGTLNFYVSTSGSDTNTGLTSDAPLATIQRAILLAASNYDITGTIVQVNLTSGVHASVNLDGTVLRANVALVGAGSALTTITSASTTSLSVVNGAHCVLSGLTIANTSSNTGDYSGGSTGLFVGSGSICNLSTDVAFGACSTGAHMWAYEGGIILGVPVGTGVGRNYSITGGAAMHLYASAGGCIILVDATVSISGDPNFSTAFAVVSLCGSIGAWGNSYIGSATGARYGVSGNGAIDVHGAGANYFPGNSDGSESNGGVYF